MEQLFHREARCAGLCFLLGLEEMRQFLSRKDESKLVKDEEGEKGTASHSEKRDFVLEKRRVKVVPIIVPCIPWG